MIEIVKYYADWCGPCKMLDPVLNKFVSDYPDVVLTKINADEDIEGTSNVGVYSLPTLIFKEDGVEYERVTGVVSYNKIKELTKV